MEELRAQYPQIRSPRSTTFADSGHPPEFPQFDDMLLEGAILAIIVVWLFLRDIRATLISAAGPAPGGHPDVLGPAHSSASR